jgi:glycine cleavage system aminomethyltransferase T
MLAPDLARRGGEIEIRGDAGVMVKARIVSTPFYDPKSARQRPAATGAGAAVAAQTGSAAA